MDLSTKSTIYPTYRYKYSKKLNLSGTLYISEDTLTGDTVLVKKIPKNEEWKNEIDIINYIKKHYEDEYNKDESGTKFLKILNYYESAFYAYIIMPYYKKYDLYDHIIINIPYRESSAKKILKKMLLCVKPLHDINIAHLDIKCENFMMLDNKIPTVILIDFGHAAIMDKSKVTKCNSKYGTSKYYCPESRTYKHSLFSDIWSLGICFHVILSGYYPYEGDDEDYDRNTDTKPPVISRKISPEANVIIKNMLKYEPTERPSINELLSTDYFKSVKM